MGLRFSWDPRKASANFRKHGVAFDEASTAFAAPARVAPQCRTLIVSNHRHLMTARLTILSFLAVMASTAAAQETLPMTASDSDAVVRGAVGAALAIRADARPICVTYIADSLATLLALSGRDTARVVVRLDGRR